MTENSDRIWIRKDNRKKGVLKLEAEEDRKERESVRQDERKWSKIEKNQ